MAENTKPHRPSYQDSTSLEALADRSDPIERLHAAHDTAAALIDAGHRTGDPALVERIITVVDDIGLPTLADLWQDRPARSLPGALYRLYLLREWIDREPAEVAREYAAGIEVGAASLTPDEVRATADTILQGAFSGDVSEALEQAAQFCTAVAGGRAHLRQDLDVIKRLQTVAEDLAASAELWSAGKLQ